ncbi:MAG: pentapeptide repeat-containing protein, partial [Pseudomonadota bacterium]
MPTSNGELFYALKSADCWKWAEARKRLQKVDLSSVDLPGIKVPDFDFSGVDLSNADLCNGDLTGARLDNANLDGADLSGAKLVELDVRDASFVGAAFDGATVFGQFVRCDFSDSTWSGSSVRQSFFSGCRFDGADFDGEEFFRENGFDGGSFEEVRGVSEKFIETVLIENETAPKQKISRTREKKDVKPVPSASNPELEAPLLDDPENAEAYLAYANWLQEQGDPRGSLIKVQHALVHEENSDVWDEEEAILQQHREHFLGEVLVAYEGPFKCEWYYGFLRTVRLGLDEDSAEDGLTLKDLLKVLLENPSAKFLQHLNLGWSPDEKDDTDVTYQEIIDLLVSTGRPKTLRSLFLGDCWSEAEMSWISVGDVSKLYKVFPKLRRLELLGGNLTLGKIDLPELRRFGV